MLEAKVEVVTDATRVESTAEVEVDEVAAAADSVTRVESPIEAGDAETGAAALGASIDRALEDAKAAAVAAAAAEAAAAASAAAFAAFSFLLCEWW